MKARLDFGGGRDGSERTGTDTAHSVEGNLNEPKAKFQTLLRVACPELTDENELRVGEPPRQANGLPRGFTLGESESSLHQEELEEGNLQTRRKSMVGRKLPKADPRHVELFFRSL